MATKFMYLRARRSDSPTGCVAFTVTDNVISYQLSIVHPRDRFDRKLARTIAEARLRKSPIVIDGKADNMQAWDMIKAVMSAIAKSTDIPVRVSDVAIAWLTAPMETKKNNEVPDFGIAMTACCN